MNVAQFRTLMDAALEDEGLERYPVSHRRPKVPDVWALPGGDIIRFFWPHAYRRPWGFVYSGGIGVEIPALRKWLLEYKRKEPGIFHTCFVSYNILNDQVLSEFSLEHGKDAPAELWAGLLQDRLARIPVSLDGLASAYRRNKEDLGWLAHPHSRHAWDFLLRWMENPDPDLNVPKMLPDGRIV